MNFNVTGKNIKRVIEKIKEAEHLSDALGLVSVFFCEDFGAELERMSTVRGNIFAFDNRPAPINMMLSSDDFYTIDFKQPTSENDSRWEYKHISGIVHLVSTREEEEFTKCYTEAVSDWNNFKDKLWKRCGSGTYFSFVENLSKPAFNELLDLTDAAFHTDRFGSDAEHIQSKLFNIWTSFNMLFRYSSKLTGTRFVLAGISSVYNTYSQGRKKDEEILNNDLQTYNHPHWKGVLIAFVYLIAFINSDADNCFKGLYRSLYTRDVVKRARQGLNCNVVLILSLWKNLRSLLNNGLLRPYLSNIAIAALQQALDSYVMREVFDIEY